ncbi:MAG: hypothetical protein FJ291_00135 [Planctomycetes bacterium]|nr:hypothetical protein [Planctomycetota bacterium]
MNATNSYADIVERWLASRLTARISGLDLRPLPHPALPDTPWYVVKGQASVIFLKQHPHNNGWLLKKFIESRRPTDEYLAAVPRCLPGGAELFTCTQRRLLTARHLDLWNSGFRDKALSALVEGTILMPKVTGSSWASVADDLRDGHATMTIRQRLVVSLSLTECVGRLEAAHCSHRDFSGLNVFVTPDGRVHLIDFDSFYHADLPFQPNTTAGTPGYMAPFLRGPSGGWDASRSWCPCADRFALAILVAEFLLVGPDTPPPREDGSLFAQAELDQPDAGFVQEQIKALERVSRECGLLLRRCLAATTFEACPSPAEWQSALRHALRVETAREKTEHPRGAFACRVRYFCAECQHLLSIDLARSRELERQGKPVLCSSCLQAKLSAQSAARLERDSAYPEVNCEHCTAAFRMPRAKLDLLRSQGRPILCGTCLPKQMRLWEAERDQKARDYPQATCAQCATRFRIRREKLEGLTAKGRPVLCRRCLEAALSPGRPAPRPIVPATLGAGGNPSPFWQAVRWLIVAP